MYCSQSSGTYLRARLGTTDVTAPGSTPFWRSYVAAWHRSGRTFNRILLTIAVLTALIYLCGLLFGINVSADLELTEDCVVSASFGGSNRSVSATLEIYSGFVSQRPDCSADPDWTRGIWRHHEGRFISWNHQVGNACRFLANTRWPKMYATEVSYTNMRVSALSVPALATISAAWLAIRLTRARALIRFRQKNEMCLGCGYVLAGLVDRRCPECARAFDPNDPWGFVKEFRRPVARKRGIPHLILALVSASMVILPFTVLSPTEVNLGPGYRNITLANGIQDAGWYLTLITFVVCVAGVLRRRAKYGKPLYAAAVITGSIVLVNIVLHVFLWSI